MIHCPLTPQAIQARSPEKETGPVLVFHLSGVAGFEPTASSSRIGPWKIVDLRLMPKVQLRV
jgi:hypothetical protein